MIACDVRCLLSRQACMWWPCMAIASLVLSRAEQATHEQPWWSKLAT